MIDPVESGKIWDRGFKRGYEKAINFIANSIESYDMGGDRELLKSLIKDLQEFGKDY